jgi:DNA-binding transcriptional LysR family regulator
MREGSLSAAARSLGLTQPSIGRHIDSLEAALGATLFTRAPDGLRPTAIAQALLPCAEAMANAAQHAVRVASAEEQETRGSVRLSASELIGGEVLPSILATFCQQHPQISIELVLSNQNDDLLKHAADIAVRMQRPTQQALVAKRLGKIDIGVFAHQHYANAHGLPRNVEQLHQHLLIGPDQDSTSIKLIKQLGLNLSLEDFALRTDSDLAQLAALRAGLGIGGCQWALARREPNLIAVLPAQLNFSLDMWLVSQEGLRNNRRVMTLFNFLASELSLYAASCKRDPQAL